MRVNHLITVVTERVEENEVYGTMLIENRTNAVLTGTRQTAYELGR